jgi:hypothetical protein
VRRWIVVATALVTAVIGIGVAEGTDADEIEPALVPVSCDQPPFNTDPQPGGTCHVVIGNPTAEELAQLECDLPRPPQAPENAKLPSCEDILDRQREIQEAREQSEAAQ